VFVNDDSMSSDRIMSRGRMWHANAADDSTIAVVHGVVPLHRAAAFPEKNASSLHLCDMSL
jgi:hypothetical protein